MTTIYRYRLYCTSEDAFKYTWLDMNQPTPTTCPTNSLHSVDTSQTSIVEKIDDHTSLVSTNNSTTTPLTSSQTFYGDWEDISNYASLSVIGDADVAGTLYCEFSMDGSIVDKTIPLNDGSSGDFGTHNLVAIAQYFRIKLVNGGTNQTSLRIQTLFQINARASLPTSRVIQTLDSYSDVLNTRSIIFGQNENNTTYSNVSTSSQNSLNVSILEPKTSFGCLLTEHLVPRVQIDAMYGILLSDVEPVAYNGASCSASDCLFHIDSGTTVGGYAVLRSRRVTRYRSGQGVRFRFSAMFSSPVVNSLQGSGAMSPTDGLLFGYLHTTFGLIRLMSGKTAIYRLQFDTGTSGSEIHTIVLNGTSFTYTSTSDNLSTNELAEEIAENKVFSGWFYIRSNENNLYFFQFIAGATNLASFSYSSDGTATGTFYEVQQGVANDFVSGFIPQAYWNVDVCDGSNSASNPSGFYLDPLKLNLYQIIFPAGGSITYQLMTTSGHFTTIHITPIPSQITYTSQKNASYRSGWVVRSVGSTTNLRVSGEHASGFNEGDLEPIRDPFSFSQSRVSSSTESVIMALRVSNVFADTLCQQEIILNNVNITTDTPTQIVMCFFYLNPTLTRFQNWTFLDYTLSSIEYAELGDSTASGRCILSFAVVGTIVYNLQPLNIRLQAGDVLAITTKNLTADETSNVYISLNWNTI